MGKENHAQEKEKERKQNPSGRLSGPFGILRISWSSYIHRAHTYLGIYLLASLAVLVLLIIAIGVATAVSGEGITTGTTPGIIAVQIILGIVLLALGVWTQASVVLVILSKRDERIGALRAYRRTIPQIWHFFWVTLLRSLIVLGGFICFIVPGIILATWFYFAQFVYIREGDRGLHALEKSREYVRGMWWPIFGRLAFIVVLTLIFFVLWNVFMWGISHILPYMFTNGLTLVIVFGFVVPFVLTYVSILYTMLQDSRGIPKVTATYLRIKIIYGVLILLGILYFIGLGYFMRTRPAPLSAPIAPCKGTAPCNLPSVPEPLP